MKTKELMAVAVMVFVVGAMCGSIVTLCHLATRDMEECIAILKAPQCSKCERNCTCTELSDCRSGKCVAPDKRPYPLP